MNEVETILEAMRADAIPSGRRGLWTIARQTLTQQAAVIAKAAGKKPIEPGSYTYLWRYTEATLQNNCGECVMNDTPGELRKHLDFILNARGRVLVTGLGLGCVLRGLLTRPGVESIDVVERDHHVIGLVWPAMVACDGYSRLNLIHREAMEYARDDPPEYDFAWHDLWSDPDKGEKHLAIVHMALMSQLRTRVKRQDAWAFPQSHRRKLREVIP